MKTNNEKANSGNKKDFIFDNDIMKSKLTSEFGMKEFGSSLPEDVENEWLNYIYDFEKMYKDSKQIKVYDFIGKPDFRKLNELSDNEISAELHRLTDILISNNIVLELCCEYDDKIIYQFITEELFEELTDDMRIEGMRHCFIYEEFHPNHDYDLRKDTEEFFNCLLKRNWDSKFDNHRLNATIENNKKNFTNNEFSKIIQVFQKPNKPFEIKSLDINDVSFSLESGTAVTEGKLAYSSINSNHTGEFKIQFVLDELGYWVIMDVMIPGFIG